MRKTLICLAIAALIFWSLPVNAAAEGPELLCIADTVDEDGGCDVALELVNAEGIAMMQFSLRYDPEKLAFLGSELGTVFTGGLAPTLNTLQSGEIVLSWDSLSPLQSDGTILLLHMRLLGAESATLYFGGDDDLIFARDDFEPLDVRCTGCTIDRPTVTATPVATPSTHPPVSEPPAQVTDPPVNITIPAAQVTATPAPVAPIHTPVPVTESPTVTTAPDLQAGTLEPVVESSAPTRAATPTPVVFHSQDEKQGLTMQDEQITIGPGETQKLEVVEEEKTLFWSSSDERVATVDENGIVTAHAEGSAQITVSNEEGTAYASSSVTVSSQGNSTKNEVQPSAAQITVEYDETENVETTTAKEETTQEKAKETTLTTEQTEAAQITAVTGQEEQKTPNSSAAFVAVVFACIIIVLFFLMRKKRLQIKSKTTEENK